MHRLLLVIVAALCIGSCNRPGEISYKNPDLPLEERVEDLLSRMTVEEKVAQMRIFHARLGIDLDEAGGLKLSEDVIQRLEQGIGGIKNPGEFLEPSQASELNNRLQEYIIKNNRHGIPALFITESYNGVDAEGCTRFGRPVTLSSSWNLDLVKEVYDVMGREARARGLHMTHSPVADMARDPRFGRMSESFGEDSHLTSEMIVRAVTGLQGDYLGLTASHIGAVTKHFAGYGQVSGGKNFASIEISPRTLHDEILPPFKAAVQRGQTLGIMASHGDINGIASHGNRELLTGILREDWGFEGYVVSDANDVGRLHYFMKVAATPEEAVEMALKAGVDLDLYADDAYVLLPDMLDSDPGLIKYIDESVRRVLRTKFILGLFDQPYTDPEEAETLVRNEDAVRLAREADGESMILLKNEKQVLPLDPGKRMTIALVGPLLGEETRSSFEEISGGSHHFLTEKGYELTDGALAVPSLTPDEEVEKGIDRILACARKADAVVLFAGGDEFTSKEAFFNGALGDRYDIKLLGLQDQLMEKLAQLGKPLIVVLKHRRTLGLSAVKKHADAILDCWELSEFGDLSIAETLYGYTVPSGKLCVSVPQTVGHLPIHYSQKEINYKKDYLFSEPSPVYPFGYGISYTHFEYSNLVLSDTLLPGPDKSLQLDVDISNQGAFTGKEVVQLYLKDEYGSVLRPDKELKAFKKISLEPGETKTVSFSIDASMLEFTGPAMKRISEAGSFIVMTGGSSEKLLQSRFFYDPDQRAMP